MAYTRTRNFRVDLSRSFYNNGSTVNNYQTFLQSDLKTGQRVEKFREKIKKGQDASSPYSRTAWVFKAEPVSVAGKGRYIPNGAVTVNSGGNGVLYPLQTPISLSVSSPENKALSRLYDSIRDKQAGMNGMLILGELRETIKMLRRPGEGLLTLFNDYLGTSKGIRQQYAGRKGGGNRRRVQKALSDLWLEYSFGWKPLISDVRDIATTVARIANDNALRTDRATGSASDSSASEDPQFTGADFITVFPGYVFRHNRQFRSEVGVKYVCGIRASTYGPTGSFEGIARETGFTLDNFVPTVWNLIPYSFLVDYFVNIGDCIDAIFADTSGVSWLCRSERRRDSVHLSSTLDTATTQSTWLVNDYLLQSLSGHGGSVFAVRNTLTRTVGTAPPLPGLTFTMPGVDSSKYWNLLALFGSKAAGAHLP